MIKKLNFEKEFQDPYSRDRNVYIKINELVDAVNALEQDKKAIDNVGRFKEGDKVLVRDSTDETWEARIFLSDNFRESGGVYDKDDVWWQHCIPFDIDKWGTV